jgi:hypothetical protein
MYPVPILQKLNYFSFHPLRFHNRQMSQDDEWTFGTHRSVPVINVVTSGSDFAICDFSVHKTIIAANIFSWKGFLLDAVHCIE